MPILRHLPRTPAVRDVLVNYEKRRAEHSAYGRACAAKAKKLKSRGTGQKQFNKPGATD